MVARGAVIVTGSGALGGAPVAQRKVLLRVRSTSSPTSRSQKPGSLLVHALRLDQEHEGLVSELGEGATSTRTFDRRPPTHPPSSKPQQDTPRHLSKQPLSLVQAFELGPVVVFVVFLVKGLPASHRLRPPCPASTTANGTVSPLLRFQTSVSLHDSARAL